MKMTKKSLIRSTTPLYLIFLNENGWCILHSLIPGTLMRENKVNVRVIVPSRQPQNLSANKVPHCTSSQDRFCGGPLGSGDCSAWTRDITRSPFFVH